MIFLHPVRAPLSILQATTAPQSRSPRCIYGRSAALRLTAWPAFVLTSLVWFLLLFCLMPKKELGYKKRTVTEGLWSVPPETEERSGETVGSLLLEIVIMLTLWYLGYWEHAFKLSILGAVIKKGNFPILMYNKHIDSKKIFIPVTSETHAAFLSPSKSQNKPPFFTALIDIGFNEQLLFLTPLMVLRPLWS